MSKLFDGRSPGERRDCTLVATCLALDLPYLTVQAAFKAAGRKDGRGCCRDVQQDAWARLGYRWVPTEHYPKAKTVAGLHKLLGRSQDCLPLLVYTRRHLTVFINTRCVDDLGPRARIAPFKGTGRLEKM